MLHAPRQKSTYLSTLGIVLSTRERYRDSITLRILSAFTGSATHTTLRSVKRWNLRQKSKVIDLVGQSDSYGYGYGHGYGCYDLYTRYSPFHKEWNSSSHIESLSSYTIVGLLLSAGRLILLSAECDYGRSLIRFGVRA